MSTAATPMAAPSAKLLPLFLVSMASVGFEIALTRWFAIVSWSEYGYWVISITMVGIAVSGVVLSLAKDWMTAHADAVLAPIPALMMLALAGGYLGVTVVDFNPLALQNQATMGAQLWRIAAYYGVLFPFFFLGGTFIGLYFMAHEQQVSRIYAADLIGAGVAGAVVVLLMLVVHPFQLPLLLLPVLLVAGWPLLRQPLARAGLALVGLLSAWVLAFVVKADYNEYKAIAAPLRVADSKVVERILSPRGVFEVLDNFTERLDVDLSNNEATLAGAEPVATYGLYGDGNRLTSLPKARPGELPYLNAALDSLPYQLLPRGGSVLLVGTRGGFRVDEAAALGAGTLAALEPDATLRHLVQGHRPDLAQDPRLVGTSPAAYLRSAPKVDLVDIAADYQSSSDIGKYSFTVEGLQGYLQALRPGGLVSVPMSIREFTVYAVKLVLTARDALAAAGVADPAKHVIVVRSAWNARVLISLQPFDAKAVATVRRWADERSFDIAYAPGLQRSEMPVWNDLPLVSFEQVTPTAQGERQDALADEIQAYFSPGGTPWPGTYDLSPATTDRPHFHSALRLTAMDKLLERIDLIPREEIGALVSMAVLLQSVVLALAVLSLPLLRRRTMGTQPHIAGRAILYFAGMGLGFLFLEIYLIEKATWFLGDRTLGFSITLAGMLLFSGVGSWLSGRRAPNPENLRADLRLACLGILAFCAVAWAGADWVLNACIALPLGLRITLLLLVIAPLGIGLGFPFALGMSALRAHPQFMPWAWSLNGAFSVVASPLANLLVIGHGNRILLVCALLLYLVVWRSLPLREAASSQAREPQPA
jgi:hypothetical protein